MKILSKIFSLRLSLFVFLFFIAIAVQAQDYIYMKDGSEYKAKVEEITPDIIKFKKFDQPDGPLRTVKVQDVISIRYQDGTEEVFGKTIEGNKAKEETIKEKEYVYSYEEGKKEERKELEKPQSKFELNGHDKYVSLGGGFGNSHGGAGIRFQFRTGGIVGFGLHCGLGLYTQPIQNNDPKFFQRVMVDFGLKMFVYKWVYLDAHLGIMGRRHESYLYDSNLYSGRSEVIFGPSFMAGVDYIIGKHLGINVGAGVSLGMQRVDDSFGINPNKIGSVTLPAMDAGVFYKF